MRKWLSLIMASAAFAGLLSAPVSAETDLTEYSVSSGYVRATAFEDVTAPFSGTLAPFDLEAGDAVQPGEELFFMLTTAVTATEDGTVRYLFAQTGESADAAMKTYGAVLAIEPLRKQRMECTYTGAVSKDEYRHLHIGEVLYFKADKEKGTGVVISTRKDAYDVEVLTGEYDAGKSLELFKDPDYDYDGKVGTGKIILREDVSVTASGMITEMAVQPGDAVKKGDTLFTVVGQDAAFGASPSVTTEAGGIIASVPVAPGQQVWKGQLLARIYRTDELEIVADADEMDLNGLIIGDAVPVTLDTDESEVLKGTVTEISSLGIQRQNAAYYTVHVSVPKSGMMLGQSASLYLPIKTQ